MLPMVHLEKEAAAPQSAPGNGCTGIGIPKEILCKAASRSLVWRAQLREGDPSVLSTPPLASFAPFRGPRGDLSLPANTLGLECHTHLPRLH